MVNFFLQMSQNYAHQNRFTRIFIVVSYRAAQLGTSASFTDMNV